MSSYYLTYSDQLSCTTSSVDCEKAWHILALLLSIGRPASLGELSSKCELFDAAPDFVRCLCSIPNSPIHLLDSGFVTVSMAVVPSMVEFASKATACGGGSVSLFGIRINGSNSYWNFDVKTYFRKRKRWTFDWILLSAAKRRSISLSNHGARDQFMLSFPTKSEDNSPEGILKKGRASVPLLLGSGSEFSKTSMMNVNHGKDEGSDGMNILEQQECCGSLHSSSLCYSLAKREANLSVLKPIHEDSFMAHSHDQRLALPSSFHDSLSCKEAMIGEVGFKNETYQSHTFCPEEDKQDYASPMEGGFFDTHSCRGLTGHSGKDEEDLPEISGDKGFIDYGGKGDTKIGVPSGKVDVNSGAPANCYESKDSVNIMTLYKEQACRVETRANILVSGHSSKQKQPVKSNSKLKGGPCKNLPSQRMLVVSSQYNKVINMSRKSDQKCLSVERNSKNSHNYNLCGKENTVNATSMSPKNNLEKRALPHFDNFIIEDEEGSGGYGTVYRARRMSDGKRCAIKCPHAKAHKHHINSELKMLERFGGRNFIIKYEGSLKDGDTECFILEHVDHDRPEVLKKEIDLFQLQWYGYCMFKALTCLHKQGVVHRDIKPGNFLFSRKLNKGYLIDFNLAMDLQRKYAVGSESKSSSHASFVQCPLPHPRTAPSTKDKMALKGDRLADNQRVAVDLKPSHEHKKSMKKRALADMSVLFRSLHQGPKIDVWSAGVSLLYLMIGRTPFTGDPEQNVKDIAKLKGSEDLWEVAKLHDRESSFPLELLDIQSLPSMELRSWCRAHTRRPEFFKLIPTSLFNLVDKCLTVNPRLRITAEEALRHEFFASCHESSRKLRMQSCQSLQTLNI
ncbi:Serine/threonine protein kinase [Parasponia andersonii]|uniref:non-specific serine/threonine protein kinase n=1 Tax=Parasponia andersonii TaxID=3476 RepID=A0A2P5CCR8_PARAD|nr:Serine/threonine protein kinase [Parasponia andersonii]